MRVEHVKADVIRTGMNEMRPTETLVNVDLGEQTVWKDSVIVLENGSRALIDYSTMDVLLDLSMSIVVPSAEWSDRESGTNFENGAGFFGSVGRFTERWSLDSTIARDIGYQVP